MSTFRCIRRRLPALMLVCVTMSIALSAQAHAASYGELSRYALGSKVTLATETDAFGVDQVDNSAFVGYKDGETGKYGIEKIKVNPGNKGEVLGTVTFKPPKGTSEGLSEEAQGVEGVAVDAAQERIYVLARYEQEEVGLSGVYVAGAVYAFKTKPEAGKLVPASGTKEGLLASFTTLKSSSTAPGGALVSPQGITIDPTTHEVIVLGEVEEGDFKTKARHLALQRITENGELGKRYVSAKTPAEEATAIELANSPVVSQTGKVFFQRGQGVFQAPSNFETTTAPTSVFGFTAFPEGVSQSEVEFDVPSEGENLGGTLSFAPSGATGGSFYSSAEISPFVVKEGRVVEGTGTPYPGALALSYSEEGGAIKVGERGWTGGQTSGVCSIGFAGETYANVAAGASGRLFVLSNPSGEAAEVIEFGPTGGGCPTAAAAPLRAEVSGKAVSSVATGTPVKLTVELTANAKSIEWNFGDGTTQTVTTGEYQTATIKHTFATPAKVKVTAKIQTDDLATEELGGEEELTVTDGSTAPKVTGSPISQEVTEPASATFEARASGSPTPSVQWEVAASGSSSWTPVGTGTSGGTTNTLSVVSTTTSESGSRYRAKFTNTAGSATSGEATLTVKAKSSSGGGGGTGGGTTGGGTTGGGTTGGGTTGGGGEVLNNKAVAPDAVIAGSSLKVSSAGAVTVKVSCPAGATSCAGTVTLRTLSAISASRGAVQIAKKAILTLASGSFTLAGGQSKTLTLHLSSKARTLLKRSHGKLRTRATVVAHDPAGEAHTTVSVVSLALAKGKH